jgi:hypothetical protein
MNTDTAILETKLYGLLLKKSEEICRNNSARCPAFWTPSIIHKWAEYLEGIGCLKIDIVRPRRGWSHAKYAKSKAPEGTQCIVNPANLGFHSFVIIPNDLALKALALGGFP